MRQRGKVAVSDGASEINTQSATTKKKKREREKREREERERGEREREWESPGGHRVH
jgi:hypothetical protein